MASALPGVDIVAPLERVEPGFGHYLAEWSLVDFPVLRNTVPKNINNVGKLGGAGGWLDLRLQRWCINLATACVVF